jgi:transposase
MHDSVTMLSVGLDYHPGSVQVCVLDAADGRVLANQACADDWRQIAGLAARHGVVRGAAVEACCGSADLAEQLIHHAGWPTALAHPGLVRRMKSGPDKHDKGDAHVLADLRRVGYLPAVWLAPAPVRELRRLVRFRQQLADRRRDVKLRVGATLRDLRLVAPAGTGSRWTKRWLAWAAAVEMDASTRWVLDEHLLELRQLQERIARAERRLTRVTADDPVVRRLLAQPGVGPVTAWVIRAEVGRFDRFRRAPPGQAAVPLLRAVAVQRVQQRAAGRPRAGEGRQPGAQDGPDRGGPPPGASRRPLAGAVRQAPRGGQAEVRRAGGRRQPVGAHAVPPDDIRRHGRPGGRPGGELSEARREARPTR